MIWRDPFLRVGEGEHPDLGGALHVPRTLPGGVFAGEKRLAAPSGVVLDDGRLTPLTASPAVDHDARVLRWPGMRELPAAEPTPPALALEATAERRALRPPTRLEQQGEQLVELTDWIYFPGQETRVEQVHRRLNTRTYDDHLLHYDGREEEEVRGVVTQARDTTDFHWTFEFTPTGGGASDAATPPGAYVGEATTRMGTAYRQVRIRHWNDTYTPQYFDETHLQGRVENLRLAGDLALGWLNVTGAYEVEVTTVLGQDRDGFGNVVATWVDAWRTLARLDTQGYGAPLDDQGNLDPDVIPLTNPRGFVGGYVTRVPSEPREVLRDTVLTPWPAPVPESDLRFSALGGQVQARGSVTEQTLTAFGHTFAGGSWAALRDAPLRDGEGRVTDWERVLILHASDTAVSAVRRDGSVQTLSRARFEREVLRVPPGTFQGFSDVGRLNNTWPPERAWCECGTEVRALAAHDPWRDSQQRRPLPDATPPPGPAHWYWPARPGKRPKNPAALPDSAPVSPLGVTLADVTGAVFHDEPLRRGEAPLLLPLTARVRDLDVRPRVAKRVLYAPCGWDEELDDRTSTSGPLDLTFELPPAPRAGETWEAALALRVNAAQETLRVNGQDLPLRRLGHNADRKRGWHPAVVGVPVSTAYTLEFRGRVSRALLCVRVMPRPT